MISHNAIIGSLIYRTREALRNDNTFIDNLNKSYLYASNCFHSGNLNLWHIPATYNEVSKIMLTLQKTELNYRFPSLLNFQSVRQRFGEYRSIFFNLSFIAPTYSEWLTEERENQIFEPLLRPIYKEFIKQVQKAEYLVSSKAVNYEYREIFTTGNNQGQLIQHYGEHIDAIELANFEIRVINNLCDSQIMLIEKENKLVTEQIV